MEKAYTVTKVDGGITITSEVLDEINRSHDFEWDMFPLDKKRFLLFPEGIHKDMGNSIDGLGRCSSNAFGSLLKGLCQQGFTGTIFVDNGRGVKRVFLKHGEICFAASNLIDDRLGEIIYRHERITIEEMAQSSVKVNRSTKFGAVLLKNKIFSTVDLWEALKLQVKEIIRSIFLVPKVYYHLQEGNYGAATAIAFDEGSIALIEDLVIYGEMFRYFLESVQADSTVILKKESPCWMEPREGTFYNDISLLVKNHGVLSEIVTHSKLKDINTYMVIFNLVCRDLVDVGVGLSDVKLANLGSRKSSMLFERYQTTNTLLKETISCFQKEGIHFPYSDMHSLLGRMVFPGGKLFQLKDTGELSEHGFSILVRLCEAHPRAYEEALVSFNSLTRFIFQISGDLLSRDASKTIKDKFNG